jgi:orotate phosphoribosyltransferase
VTPYITLTADYLEDAFDPDGVLARVKPLLADVQYDTLVGTGLSGSLVVPFLARALGKQYAIVRKSDHHSGDHVSQHSICPVEGTLGHRWVFVDDLICSGATRERVLDEVRRAALAREWSTVYVGTVLYRGSGSYYSARVMP